MSARKIEITPRGVNEFSVFFLDNLDHGLKKAFF